MSPCKVEVRRQHELSVGRDPHGGGEEPEPRARDQRVRTRVELPHVAVRGAVGDGHVPVAAVRRDAEPVRAVVVTGP